MTCVSDYYKITSQAANIVGELNSSQEDDARLILHAARSGYKAVVVAADTDIFLLCLVFKCFILVKCRTQTRTRYAESPAWWEPQMAQNANA